MTMRILIIDDDPDIGELLSALLTARSHKVFYSSSGKEALEFLKTQSVDLILLDLLMPEMDGWETLKNIQSIEVLKHIQVFILTALELDSINLGKILQMGAKGIFIKPLDLEMFDERFKVR